MSLDRSLKAANALIRHRNVLTRAERIDRLVEAEKWDDSKGVLGLPKVGNRKLETKGGGGKEAADEGDAAAATGAKAAGAKAAAPAAKGAAPAGKAAPAAKAAAPAAKKK